MSEQAAQTADILNPVALMARVGGDEALLVELVDLFLESSPELLAQLRDSVRQQDADRMCSAAHALRGVIANFSEGPAYAAARRLEELARGAKVTGTAEVLADLEREVQRLLRELLGYTGRATAAASHGQEARHD